MATRYVSLQEGAVEEGFGTEWTLKVKIHQEGISIVFSAGASQKKSQWPNTDRV